MKQAIFNLALGTAGCVMFFTWSSDFIERGGWYGYIPFIIALFSITLMLLGVYKIKDEVASRRGR